ncbi:MAG: hypothetical protein KKD44_01575 [Proteobacteria bacterium]|nr:hypothetical protein [Pseudomonadota bacterium]
MKRDAWARRLIIVLFIMMVLVNCTSTDNNNDTDTPPTGNNTDANTPPTISGTPLTLVVAGNTYTFSPLAFDADGDSLAFSITNMPDWVVFDSTTGVISGIPGAEDEGTYEHILISVTDGSDTTALPEFSIYVLGRDDEVENYTGIPLPHVLLTNNFDNSDADWQANPEPWTMDPRTVETPGWPSGWPGTVVENHWYIDNTHGDSTDTDMGDNAIDGIVYGTPQRPRATLMGSKSDFEPGTYIEIQGGPYNSGAGLWRFFGTAEAPCWVTSDPDNHAILAGSAQFSLEGSSWVTIENLTWDPEAAGAVKNTLNSAIMTTYNGSRGSTHHVTLRHLFIQRWSYIGGGSGIFQISSSNLEGGTETHHIMIYDVSAIEAANSEARGCDWSTTDCDNHMVGISTRTQDGVTTNSTHHIWILDCHSQQISGNQVQAISLGVPNVDWRELVHHIYMGGNTHGDSRQSGWWAKRSSNFIVSSCRSWGNRGVTGGNGQSSGMQYGPDWVWFINNEFHDSDFGIQQTDTNEEDSLDDYGTLFILGNRFYNIRRFTYPDLTSSWRGGFGISAWKPFAIHYIAFNTCVECESGLVMKIGEIRNARDGAFVWNNIVQSISDDPLVGTFVSYNPNDFVWVHNNIFWDEDNFHVGWGNSTFGYDSLSEWEGADDHVYGNLNLDPLLANLFTTYPERDFSIAPLSQALGLGADTAADGTDPFALFQERYGMDIRYDVNGNERSIPYSAGAYE